MIAHLRSSSSRVITLLLGCGLAAACGSTPPPPPPAPVAARPPAPKGPTRTSFKTIAKKLVSRCVGGGWINRWRSELEDDDTAKPRVLLTNFADKTGQDLDPSYLQSILAQRMRVSGVFDVVDSRESADFVAEGELLRLAERGTRGRYSVYTAILKMKNPATDRTVHSCEATVKGEM